MSYDGCRTAGHGSAKPTTLVSSKQNLVYVNGKKALVHGDKIVPHSYEDNPPHDGEIVAETPLIFINGVAVAQIGDWISCGDMVSEASDFVFIND